MILVLDSILIFGISELYYGCIIHNKQDADDFFLCVQ